MNEAWVIENLPCENGSVILCNNENGIMGTLISDFVVMFNLVDTSGDVYSQMIAIGTPLGFLSYIAQWHAEGRF